MFDNWRYRFGWMMERLVNDYIDEFNDLRTSTSLGYLIKSFGFYSIPWFLTYTEIFGYRTWETQLIALYALGTLPLMIVSGIRAYWGIVYYIGMYRSKQKRLSDYQ